MKWTRWHVTDISYPKIPRASATANGGVTKQKNYERSSDHHLSSGLSVSQIIETSKLWNCVWDAKKTHLIGQKSVSPTRYEKAIPFGFPTSFKPETIDTTLSCLLWVKTHFEAVLFPKIWYPEAIQESSKDFSFHPNWEGFTITFVKFIKKNHL